MKVNSPLDIAEDKEAFQAEAEKVPESSKAVAPVEADGFIAEGTKVDEYKGDISITKSPGEFFCLFDQGVFRDSKLKTRQS